MENHEQIYIEIHTNSFSVDLLQISAPSSTYYLPLLFRHSERYLVLFQAPKLNLFRNIFSCLDSQNFEKNVADVSVCLIF